MNDKDKEAFEKWKLEYISTHTCYFKMIGTDDVAQVVWQSSCNYKQKEIDELKTQDQIIAKEIKTYMAIAEKLKAENVKLRECVEFYADTTGWDNGKKSGEASYTRAREALAAINSKY